MIIDMSVTLFTGCVRLSPPTCTSLFAGLSGICRKERKKAPGIPPSAATKSM